ncbi:hypothetical protein QO014_003109 [Kaistia dalseonensis]|uniref:Uncharacterized protein n=1 Tax=Kaistia dalseonensis TaxID=410840 RepID=A0ABU0H8T1_9HYPH|nr:hypothetical protein [Kaistia dalseonensis]
MPADTMIRRERRKACRAPGTGISPGISAAKRKIAAGPGARVAFAQRASSRLPPARADRRTETAAADARRAPYTELSPSGASRASASPRPSPGARPGNRAFWDASHNPGVPPRECGTAPARQATHGLADLLMLPTSSAKNGPGTRNRAGAHRLRIILTPRHRPCRAAPLAKACPGGTMRRVARGRGVRYPLCPQCARRGTRPAGWRRVRTAEQGWAGQGI